jgi:hypothetical protein
MSNGAAKRDLNPWTTRLDKSSLQATPALPLAEKFALFAASEHVLAVRWVCLCVPTLTFALEPAK